MTIEEEIATLRIELDAANLRITALDGLILVLTGIIAETHPRSAKAIPAALMEYADQLRDQGDEAGAITTTELADRLVRLLPPEPDR